jgi:hypothetical protein
MVMDFTAILRAMADAIAKEIDEILAKRNGL